MTKGIPFLQAIDSSQFIDPSQVPGLSLIKGTPVTRSVAQSSKPLSLVSCHSNSGDCFFPKLSYQRSGSIFLGLSFQRMGFARSVKHPQFFMFQTKEWRFCVRWGQCGAPWTWNNATQTARILECLCGMEIPLFRSSSKLRCKEKLIGFALFHNDRSGLNNFSVAPA